MNVERGAARQDNSSEEVQKAGRYIDRYVGGSPLYLDPFGGATATDLLLCWLLLHSRSELGIPEGDKSTTK